MSTLITIIVTFFSRYGRRPWNWLCGTKRSSSNKPYAHYIFREWILIWQWE